MYFQSKKAEENAISWYRLKRFITYAIILGAIALIFWVLDEKIGKPNRERKRLEEQHERNEILLERQLIKKIYANQRLELFESDGLQIKPFAQEILKLIGKLIST